MTSSVWTLPSTGSLGSVSNAQTQLGQAQKLLDTSNAAIGGKSSAQQDLLGAGVTLAANLLPGGAGAQVGAAIKVGVSLVDFGMAVASGAAMGGPIGAVAGAVSTLVSAVLSSPGATLLNVPSKAATQIFQARQQWYTAGHVGGATSRAAGSTLCDYLARAYPAHTTKRQADLWTARINAWSEYTKVNRAAGSGDTNTGARVSDFQAGKVAGIYGNGKYTAGGGIKDWQGTWNAKVYASMVQTVSTDLPFKWGTLTESDLEPSPPGTSLAVANNDDYGVMVSMPATKYLEHLAQSDIIPLTSNGRTLSSSDIWKSAIARRPDPLYWAADLYIWNNTTGGGFAFAESFWTTIYNCEALNMLATWCAMVQAGASTRAILSELLSQQLAIQSQSGDGSVPYLCRMMVEDVLAMAHQEWRESKPGAMHLATVSRSPGRSLPAPTSPTQAALLTVAAKSNGSGGAAVPWVVGGVGATALALYAGYKYLL